MKIKKEYNINIKYQRMNEHGWGRFNSNIGHLGKVFRPEDIRKANE
jgi:hypothetical protein